MIILCYALNSLPLENPDGWILPIGSFLCVQLSSNIWTEFPKSYHNNNKYTFLLWVYIIYSLLHKMYVTVITTDNKFTSDDDHIDALLKVTLKYFYGHLTIWALKCWKTYWEKKLNEMKYVLNKWEGNSKIYYIHNFSIKCIVKVIS